MMKIQYENQIIEMDDALSQKDFTGWNFSNLLDFVFDYKNVYMSCFSQENPNTKIFPKNMIGTTFYNSNLDNVEIPEGITLVNCSNRQYKIENDGNHWELDQEGNPLHPLDYKIFEKKGLPIPKPEDIPKQKVEKRINLLEVAQALSANEEII